MGYARPFSLEDSAAIGRVEPGGRDKLLGLELLRFAAALAVLIYHYRHFAHVHGVLETQTSVFPLYGLLWPIYDYGLYGVQLFWGISGYIFFLKYGAAIRAGAVSARNFFWLRFSRLYPLHIVTLVGIVGLQAIHWRLTGTDFVYPATDPALFGRQLFLATDWGAQSPFSFNGPIWSVSAEVAVYAAFFLLLRRFAPSMALCAGVVALGLIVQLLGLNWVSIGCATYFFAGGLAANAPDEWRRPAAVALAMLILVAATTDVLGDRGKLPTILLIGIPCLLILLADGGRGLDRWQLPIQTAGNLTYSSYLLHFPLQLLVAILVAASGIALPFASPLLLIAYVSGTLAVAALSYRAFEVPVQNWLRQRTLTARAAT